MTAWEDLHAAHVDAGNAVDAARAATMVALYPMMDTGLMAPVRGWIGRAERLLADHDETPVHALLAIVLTYERLGAVAGWVEIGAPWEAASARMVLGEAHRKGGSATSARLEWSAAGAAFERLGAQRWAEVANAAATSDESVGRDQPEAIGGATRTAVPRRDGDMRTVTFAGSTVLLHDLKGLRYLERLLAEPGRQFHVLDLVTVEAGSLPTDHRPGGPDLELSGRGDAGFLLDDQARAAYRRRVAEAAQDIDEAARMNDPERAALARIDRDDLIRIAEHHPTLAAHLEHTLRTGTYCSCAPGPTTPVFWEPRSA